GRGLAPLVARVAGRDAVAALLERAEPVALGVAERDPARLRVAARGARHATDADGHPAEGVQVRGLEDGLDGELDVDAAAGAPGAQRDLRRDRRRVGLGVRGRVAAAPGVLVEVDPAVVV